jgi:crotonobetainyl-CoA:carnitine CoA-transferase CaiB-like acyl-CoA transferase
VTAAFREGDRGYEARTPARFRIPSGLDNLAKVTHRFGWGSERRYVYSARSSLRGHMFGGVVREMNISPSSTGPLAGLKVVDMTTSYAGPTASMYLGDLGADVVKVERPNGGDESRAWGPPFVDGVSAWFASANRNKRSIAVDIRSNGGVAVLNRLMANADVFIENLNPDKLAGLGIDPHNVRARYPRLIYCALSGFGLTGPHRHLAGYDLAAQARSGMMSVTGAPGHKPQRVSSALSDVATGMCAALAIGAAVVRQRGEGIGDTIDVSLLDSDLAIMAPRIAAYMAGEAEPQPSGGTDSVLAIYQTFPTRDRDIVVAIGNDLMWQRFCAAIGLEGLRRDPAFVSNAGRRAERHVLVDIISQKLIERDADDWHAILAEAAVPCSYVQSLSEVVADRQVIDRNCLLPVPGSSGALHTVHPPFRFASIERTPNGRYPDLGSDTYDVLSENGFDRDEIVGFIESGAVYLSSNVQEAANR